MSAKAENVAQKRRGRKPGQANVTTRNRNRLIANAEIQPLQVLIEVMTARYNEAKGARDPEKRKELERDACQVAEKVAPYLHPRLQATTLKGDAGNPVSFVLSLPGADVLKAAVRGEDKGK